MARYGDFFPENPQTLDELLEAMARRMAAMQAFLNSLTPEQRAQLSALSAQLLDDMDLRWQVDRLQQHLQGAFPGEGWGPQFQTRGRDPLGMAGAVDLMERLGNLDQLENLLSSAPSPGALAEVDFDVARELLGDDGAASLERLAELARMLDRRRPHREPGGPAGADAPGPAGHRPQRAWATCSKAGQGPGRAARAGAGGPRPRAGLLDQALRVGRPVQPRHPAHAAQRRHPPGGTGTPVRAAARRTSRSSGRRP